MFKNAKVFRLRNPFTLNQLQLHERLEAYAFRPCGPLETMTLGWVAPLGDNAHVLAHLNNDCLMITARRQERLLPAGVISEALTAKVAEIEQNEMRDVGRRERTRLREMLLSQMLPQAFTQSRLIAAYIDCKHHWFVVDTSSDTVAEAVLSLLRQTLDSLPARPLQPTVSVSDRMTMWVASGRAIAGLELEDQCELRDAVDQQSVVRCRGQDLTAPEIKQHLNAGKRVVVLSLTWQDRLSFLLDEELGLKRLRLTSMLTDAPTDADTNDELLRFDAELTLMTGELRALLNALTTEFGCQDEV
ncbi:recombination-associated protein RdgC [Thiospirillum jenense]|uniref:Recombination-associated protein RdgC n=1 Tax=Thiospirillum jenense TaxID=1653858 RepID=A0A839HJQ5_9GAMM|nr:recombination-associated protein RdgC [Thiospirillum jenense]